MHLTPFMVLASFFFLNSPRTASTASPRCTLWLTVMALSSSTHRNCCCQENVNIVLMTRSSHLILSPLMFQCEQSILLVFSPHLCVKFYYCSRLPFSLISHNLSLFCRLLLSPNYRQKRQFRNIITKIFYS